MRPERTVLLANVHFDPNSFGGATIVAENIAKDLYYRKGWRVIVFTSHQDSRAHPYTITRYSTNYAHVFSIALPHESTQSFENTYVNTGVTSAFQTLLERISLDVAHLHSIQGLGVGLLETLRSKGVPTVTTVHDCWWICERMFMINRSGRYCDQWKIDKNVCAFCVDDSIATDRRRELLFDSLHLSDVILFPSRFQKELFLANGLQSDKAAVNKNGVRFPAVESYKLTTRDDTREFRFGFIGGPGEIKGSELIRQAFQGLSNTNYVLKVVDGARNRGMTWAPDFQWTIPGKLELVDPYTQDTMDDFFTGIDVLLFPSQWKESFGLTVREALVRGVWVIATDGGGASEDCVDGENSTLIPMTQDPNPLKGAIKMILEKGLSVIESDTLDQIVSTEQQVDELVSIYDQLLLETKPV